MIERIVAQGSTVTRADIVSVLEDYHTAIESLVLEGVSVNTPSANYSASIRGVFEGQADGFDPGRHQVRAVVNAGKRFRRVVQERAQAVKGERIVPRPNPVEFTDVNTGERNSLLTPGGMAQVVGHRLKFDPADAAQGIFFVAEGGAETKVDVVGQNKPASLMFIVPQGLAPGDYTLEVRAVTHGSDEVRSGACTGLEWVISRAALSVEGASAAAQLSGGLADAIMASVGSKSRRNLSAMNEPVSTNENRYGPFDVAIYCPARDVRRMADLDWLEANWDMLCRYLRIDKVYLETFRSSMMVSRETMLKAKQFFEDRGVKVSGGITTTLHDGFPFRTFCYTDEEQRQKMVEIVRYTAELFDEIILDDFFFTTCKCSSCIRAKGERSWAAFRLDLMAEVSRNLVLKPAREANPAVNVIIKYPNWYEHYAYSGYNLEVEPQIFDMIYTGTETRDAEYTHQHLQAYHGYSIMRYLENVKPGKNGGGWIDPFMPRHLSRYGEQIALTLFAKPREVTLFCFGALLQPILGPVSGGDGATIPASMVAPVAGDVLARAGAFLDHLGEPVGVQSYKPYHSSGEDYVHSYIGMLGVPVELTPEFPEDARIVLLAESAKFDPAIVARIDKHLQGGKDVMITSGLLRALQGKGIEDIVELEYTGKRAVAERFSDFFDTYHATRPILLPQIKYATNDSWEVVTALSQGSGYPLLHRAEYGKGMLYVLAIPDNMGDLYALPPQALAHIRRVLMQDIYVRLEGPSEVCLFVYDNGAFIVHSFLPHAAQLDIVLSDGSGPLLDLTGGQTIQGTSREDGTGFRVRLWPRSYRVFKCQQ